MVIVDTSAWIEFFRRDGDTGVKLAVKGLLDEFEAALCGPVEMEFLGGAKESERNKIGSWFKIIPYLRNDQTLWRKAAGHYAKIRAKGLTVPWNDVLIGTIAAQENLCVYSNDRHFPLISHIVGFGIYTPGYNGQYNPDN